MNEFELRDLAAHAARALQRGASASAVDSEISTQTDAEFSTFAELEAHVASITPTLGPDNPFAPLVP